MKRKYWLVGGVAVLVASAIGLLLPANHANISELAKQPTANSPSLYDQVVGQSDLPPEGTRSLFDHVIAQNDGLPYPFEKLVKLIRDQHPPGTAPITVLIPDGRSLLKAQANYHHPRALIAADFELANNAVSLGVRPRGQLFMGFVENAHEIEVLSYNEAAGRFEFQLVQNYCDGCVPRIVYAQRAICTTCHQGGGPIFPQRPWNETNGQPDTAAAIRSARQSSSDYVGIALSQPLASPERFDQLTDEGNFISVSQRIWLDGCGVKGEACRRLLLKLALLYRDSPGSFDPNSDLANQLRAQQEKHFPADGFMVPESDIFNRDPLGERRGWKGWLRGIFSREIKLGEGAINNEDLKAFDDLPKLPARLDPLSKRPPKQVIHASDIDGAYGIAALFSESDMAELGAKTQYQPERLMALVDALPASVFAEKAFVRVHMMRALLIADKNYCCISTHDMSPPRTSAAPPLVIKQHLVLKDFERYCFACHRGNPAKRLNFMGAENESQVLAEIQDKSAIRDALDWERYEGTEKANKLMPPRDSAQYRLMQDDNEKGQAARQSMREAVPSLFGF